jgi:hypothetical protein
MNNISEICQIKHTRGKKHKNLVGSTQVKIELGDLLAVTPVLNRTVTDQWHPGFRFSGSCQ